MPQNAKYDRALKNALASTRMEGFTVTAETERDCKRLLLGEVTTAALVEEIKRKYAKREVK